MSVEYRTGDVLDCPERPLVLVHVVNDIGAWGAGFTRALTRRIPAAETAFRAWARRGDNYRLGSTLVSAHEGVFVAHLCVQHGIGTGIQRLDVAALKVAFREVTLFLDVSSPAITVAMPRIGCGLAGGTWAQVEPLVNEALEGRHGVVYTLPGGTF